MATILTQQREENPWGTVAANLAGSLIGNIIERTRANDENRKLNALLYEAMNAANNQGQNLLSNQTVPDGYNVDPWASAFHQNYTPMTQYNLGTANVTPFVQGQGNIPDVQAMRNAVLQNLGTKRFSMLNPATVEQYMNPYYQAAEKAAQDARTKEFADKLAAAQNSADRRNIAWSGATQGVVPWDALNVANNEYRYDNLSEADKAAILQKEKEFNESQRRYDSDMDYNRERDARAQTNFERTYGAGRTDADRDYYLRERAMTNQEDAARYARENPGYSSIITGDDGGQWAVNQYGQTKKLETGTADSSPRLTPVEQAQINDYRTRMSELEKQRQELYKLKADIQKSSITGDGGNTEYYDNRIANIDDELNAIQGQINSIWQSKAIKNSDVTVFSENEKAKDSENIGSLILGGASVHPKGTYGYDRGDHKHQGIDLPKAEGTPIPIHKEMGENLTVKRIANNPGGYGNYIDIEGQRDGHKIEFRFAHLKDDGIKVKQGQKIKAGDVIAEVGSTGRSSGPHLHLEIRVDDKKVDPEKFFTEYGRLEDKIDNSISQDGYKELLRQVNIGEIRGVPNEQVLQQKLKERGIDFDTGIKSSDVKPFSDDAEPAISNDVMNNDVASDDITSNDVNVFATPNNEQASQEQNQATEKRDTKKIFPRKDFEYLVKKAKQGTLYYARNEQQVRDYLAERGYRIEGE